MVRTSCGQSQIYNFSFIIACDEKKVSSLFFRDKVRSGDLPMDAKKCERTSRCEFDQCAAPLLPDALVPFGSECREHFPFCSNLRRPRSLTPHSPMLAASLNVAVMDTLRLHGKATIFADPRLVACFPPCWCPSVTVSKSQHMCNAR